VGGGAFTIDYARPEPDPPPVTTIAWRLGHMVVGVLGARVAAHFGGPAVDHTTFAWPARPTASLVLHVHRARERTAAGRPGPAPPPVRDGRTDGS
jgi:hypothetical protein